MDPMPWILREPLNVTDSADGPYLQTAMGTLGEHELVLHHGPAWATGADFRVFLDGVAIFELGMVMPAVGWFRLCRDQGLPLATP